MLILSVNLATKKTPQTNKPHASRTAEHKFILVEDRTFCCCSVGKVFPAAHSSLPLIWTISLFSGDILLYNGNLDIWNLLGMFHGSSVREADPLWWRQQPRRLTARLREEEVQDRLECALGRWILMREKYLERMLFWAGSRAVLIITRALLCVLP